MMCDYFLPLLLAICVFRVSYGSGAVKDGENYINIWILPHTHDDTGWVKTVDEYYVQQVHWILETVTQALLENPERRFMYVEMAFFHRWWNEIDNDMKQKVLHVIRNGQLQLNLAGWCMNDEAATHYAGVIDQMTEGAMFAMEELKNRSTVGWHIDPFGHSSVTPSLWADIGFNAFSISRINFQDLERRKSQKQLEFVWRGSKTLGKSRDMWTHILDSHYCTPPECAYDTNLYVQNDPSLPSYHPNIEDQAESFVSMARDRGDWYRHNHILIPFGCDFAHVNAEKSFIQMDELMAYVNNDSSFQATVRYGTLDDYTRAIHSLGLTWDVYEDDFFPYVSGPEAYWTGFYTSRPQLKGYVRSMRAFLQGAETLYSLGAQVLILPKEKFFEKVNLLRRAVAVSQHHDAITGTERSYVVADYISMMKKGRAATSPVVTDILAKLIGGETNPPDLTLNLADLLLHAKSGDKVAAVVYNSLGWNRQSYVSISVSRHDLSVVDSTGKIVPSDILVFPGGGKNDAEATLYFRANVPPLGFQVYYIQVGHGHITKLTKAVPLEVRGLSSAVAPRLENEFYQVNFSSTTGRMTSIFNKQTKKTLFVNQNLFQYVSASEYGQQASGAYIFRPARDNYTVIVPTKGHSLMSHDVHFYQSFLEHPIVIMSPNVPDDLFALSIASMESNNMTVNAYHIGGGTYISYNITATFWAFDSKTIPPGSQLGSWEIGYSVGRRCKTFFGTFVKPFRLIPRLLATVRMSKSKNEAYAASAFNVSLHGASFNVCRVDDSFWTQQIFVDWIAFEPNASFSSNVVHGSKELHGTKPVSSRYIYVELPDNLSIHDAGVLAMVTCDSQVLIVSASLQRGDYAPTSFEMVIGNIDYAPWAGDIKVDWLLFERSTLQLPVTSKHSTVHVAIGSYVSEIRQDFKHGYSQVFRVFGSRNGHGEDLADDQYYVESEYLLGPIEKGREVITRFTTDLVTNGTFYTDENGLEMKKRVFDINRFEKIAGNYYPLVAASYLENVKSGDRLTFLSDRAHGCSSLSDGEFEVMLHRRCLKDDGFGLGQVLDDTSKIRAKLWMIYSDSPMSSYLQRRLALLLENPVTLAYANVSDPALWSHSYKQYFTGLKKELPPNVHLLSLRPVAASKSDLILRLQHIFEADEHPKYSHPVDIYLSELFSGNFSASNPVEMSLTANVLRSVAMKEQLKWKTGDGAEFENDLWTYHDDHSHLVKLSPREIRTFIINGS
ncbi:lysosomal alpha-mannosidase-like isoform X2 [Corticium candelabrum]|uniref:lysosomal alpha-mannosidase-like isoform X2 n=1 Tax=Corticium candelabrum TaxID=121492 RepID=UPI002E270D28|nr:lysosomal alpha-mannosidase-like isoform X2 [Corticium candelabrum]